MVIGSLLPARAGRHQPLLQLRMLRLRPGWCCAALTPMFAIENESSAGPRPQARENFSYFRNKIIFVILHPQTNPLANPDPEKPDLPSYLLT